ncbi:MAG: aminotransferase class I/II-fold pyridoxal phosphate-dependent enzyme [Enterobacterales bacterium]|nr:aminotransferase class I/II-fold pyridoxal phosphate-dependent enzyme [Enterobacterales bacterium]
MDYLKYFKSDAQEVAKQLDSFLNDSIQANKMVINQRPMETLISELGLADFIADGDLHGDKLSVFLSHYLDNCTRLHHPGFLAQQVAPSHPAGGLGSFIDGVTNNAMAIYEMGPAASSIEYFMLNWLLAKVGWRTVTSQQQLDPDSDHAGGTLTHGGSLGNLTALLAARSACLPTAWEEGITTDVVVLVPEQSHYSLKRTIGMLGIGTNNCLKIAADEAGRIDPHGLQQQIADLHAAGKTILAVVANGCGTAVGLYDAINILADICEEHGIWLHLDAAHGGMALLSDKSRHLLDGIERVDSIVWDAHKMMMTPTLCAAVLVRDHRHLDQAFKTEASYLLHEKEQPGYDFLLRNVECTKAGLGLRFFMSIAAQGEAQLVNYYDGVVALTKRTAQWIEQQDDLTLAVMPQTNILCFRYQGADSLQFKIRDEILRGGDFYLSTTEYRDQRWLRLVFMNANTTWADIERLMALLRELATRYIK